MRPTRVRDLLGYAAAAAIVVYLLLLATYDRLPRLPRTGALTALVLAGVAFSLASSTKARLRGGPGTKPIVPLVVARLAALAKAGSAVGATLAGAWLGALGYLAGVWELQAAHRDALTAVLSLVSAVGLTVGALRLEQVCKVPRPPASAEVSALDDAAAESPED